MEKIIMEFKGDNGQIEKIAVPKADIDAVNHLHLDANETAFLLKELQYIKSKTYDKKYENIYYTDYLPIETDIPETAEQIQYDSYSTVGMAAVIANYAQNAPRVDVYKESKYANVRRIGNYFGYDNVELKRGATTNARLSTRLPNAAREAIEQKMNNIAWNGDSSFGLQGLINYPGILEYTIPNDGTGATKTWSTKTVDQIIRDIVGMINYVMDTTNGIEVPDTLAIPVSQYMDLTTRRLSDTNSSLIMYVKENIPMLKNVYMLPQLKGAGAGATNRAMVYAKNPDKLAYQLVKPFTQLPPQPKGYGVEIPCEAFSGGVIVYYPYSVCFGDGI